jgi:hypothetical protein
MPCNLETESRLKAAAKQIACPNSRLSETDVLNLLLAVVDSKSTSIVTEAHDKIDLAYVGSTNNLDTVEYSLNGTIVATLTFTYVGGTPVSDDALLESVVKS